MVKKALRSAEKFSEPFPLSPLLLYPSPTNAVVLNAVVCKNAQMSKNECKRAQMTAKERKRKRAQKSAKGRKRVQRALLHKNCKQPGLKQPGLGPFTVEPLRNDLGLIFRKMIRSSPRNKTEVPRVVANPRIRAANQRHINLRKSLGHRPHVARTPRQDIQGSIGRCPIDFLL